MLILKRVITPLNTNNPNGYIPQIRNAHIFPHPSQAINGILAWGGDLNPNRVLKAYLQGIFPWYNEEDPILWWSPNPRCVLFLDDFKTSKSLKKSLKKYEVRFDTNFEATMRMCQKVRTDASERTWIIEDIIECYTSLHKMGFAHSVETYYEGQLVGGLYGISFGGIFCGESMFATMPDASKVALYTLVQKLKEWDFDVIDAQVPSKHLFSLGATTIQRDMFLDILEKTKQKPSRVESWNKEA